MAVAGVAAGLALGVKLSTVVPVALLTVAVVLPAAGAALTGLVSKRRPELARMVETLFAVATDGGGRRTFGLTMVHVAAVPEQVTTDWMAVWWLQRLGPRRARMRETSISVSFWLRSGGSKAVGWLSGRHGSRKGFEAGIDQLGRHAQGPGGGHRRHEGLQGMCFAQTL